MDQKKHTKRKGRMMNYKEGMVQASPVAAAVPQP
jgi:hypothetical protein